MNKLCKILMKQQFFFKFSLIKYEVTQLFSSCNTFFVFCFSFKHHAVNVKPVSSTTAAKFSQLAPVTQSNGAKVINWRLLLGKQTQYTDTLPKPRQLLRLSFTSLIMPLT